MRSCFNTYACAAAWLFAVATVVYARGEDSGADSAVVQEVSHPPSGWTLRLPEGWRKPKGYATDGVEQIWDSKGISHRIPPDADADAVIAPSLIWWGEPVPDNQTINQVVDVLAQHNGQVNGLKKAATADIKIDGRPAKRISVLFRRSVPFAPLGKGHGDVRAVLYLVRHQGQENGIWFESPAADFDRYEPVVEEIATKARIKPRRQPKQ